MSRFYYEAIDQQGRKVPGVLDCESEARLMKILEEKGQTMVAASTRPLAGAGRAVRKLKGGRASGHERSSFATQMGRLMDSGCPMDRALELVLGTLETQHMANAVEAIRTDVTQGQSLHQAMTHHADIFPPLFLASVRAGEAGGFLAKAFARLAVFESSQDKLRRKIVHSMVYPAFMVITLALCLIVIFVFVVPSLLSFFQKSNMVLPAPTQFLIGLSNNFPAVLGGIFGAGFLVWFLRWRFGRTPAALEREDRLRLVLPLIGGLTQTVALARFCRTMSLLLDGGVVLTKALEITREAMGNRVLEQELQTVAEQVTGGESLSQCLEVSPHFPPLLAGQVRFGEETGSLGKVLENLAEEYEQGAERSLETLVGLVEPMMIVVMGGVMGFVVISLFMPLVQMVSSR